MNVMGTRQSRVLHFGLYQDTNREKEQFSISCWIQIYRSEHFNNTYWKKQTCAYLNREWHPSKIAWDNFQNCWKCACQPLTKSNTRVTKTSQATHTKQQCLKMNILTQMLLSSFQFMNQYPVCISTTSWKPWTIQISGLDQCVLCPTIKRQISRW